MPVVIAVVAVFLLLCMASATPEHIRHARENPPRWLNVAFWMSIVGLAILFGQFLLPDAALGTLIWRLTVAGAD